MKKITYSLILTLLLSVLGCKEKVKPCSISPVSPICDLIIKDKLTNLNMFQNFDSLEMRDKKGSSSFYYLDSINASIVLNLNENDTKTILFKIKPKRDFDKLLLYYNLGSWYSEDCGWLPSFRFDSIYHNNKKIELNTIYY
jgi:hypothetical protein